MKQQLINLIEVNTSPFSPIVSIANPDYPQIRKFLPPVSACHIGNGFIITCAHHLQFDTKIPVSLSKTEFNDKVLPLFNDNEKKILKKAFVDVPEFNMLMAHIPNPDKSKEVQELFGKKKYDTRIDALENKGITRAFAIYQFPEPKFFGDELLPARFPSNRRYKQPVIDEFSFMVEVEKVYINYSDDIALYKMINLDEDIISFIPSIDVSFDMHSTGDTLYCLQTSATASNLGKMVTEYHIDGLLNEFLIEQDPIHGFSTRKGLRYFADGFVRIGTSGSPVLAWDEISRTFKVNAIASEACNNPVTTREQKEVTNNIIKVVCTPLANVEDEIKAIIYK